MYIGVFDWWREHFGRAEDQPLILALVLVLIAITLYVFLSLQGRTGRSRANLIVADVMILSSGLTAFRMPAQIRDHTPRARWLRNHQARSIWSALKALKWPDK